MTSTKRMLASLLLASMLAAATHGVQAQALTIEEIVALKRVSAIRLSPDGEHVAYVLTVPREVYRDDDGRPYQELHVVDLDGNSRPFVTGDVNIANVAWSPDSASIWFTAKRDPDATYNSLYRIAMAGGEAVEMFTHENNIGRIFPSPDGQRMAFTANEAPPDQKKQLESKGFKAVIYEESVPLNRVFMLDLDSGEAEMQALTGSASAFTWSSDGARFAVALAPTALVDDSFMANDIYVVDAASGEVQNSMESVGKLGYFEFSPDGERIAYIGSVDINDPSQGRLYVASSAGGERRDLVPDYLGHVGDLSWYDDVSLRWLGHRGVWTELQTSSIMSAEAAGPAPEGGPILRTMEANAGQAHVVAIADTPAHPPEVYLLRDGEARRLTDSNPLLADRQLARQEAITYSARDGLEVEAILMHPPERQRAGNPLIVFVHGGPEAHYSNGWMSNYSQPAQALAAEGYAIVWPNYRGSTGRGVEFSKLDQHDYAEEEFNDLVDAKRFLVAEGIADGDRTGISGGSYGGYATMWAATALSEEFAAGVAFVGISNQTSKFGTGDIPYEMYHVHSLAWPWDDWMWMLRRSPIYHAGNAQTPLLILGGDKDPRVHPGQSLEMYRHIKLRTDTPVRLVIYPGEVHGNRNTAARYDYALRLQRWMQHYLQGPGGALPPYEIDHATRLEKAAD